MSTANTGYLAFRPLLADFVLSMPRRPGHLPEGRRADRRLRDVGPGMRVLEAGAGSGALTCSLLRAVGSGGSVTSYERREDFADVARGNVGAFFGEVPANWSLRLGDLAEHLAEEVVDRVVLDMLEPWAVLPTVAAALRPGGVLVGYVATVTQLSTYVEALRAGCVDRAARLGDAAAAVARGRAGRPPRAPDGRAHRLPGHGATAGRRTVRADPPAQGARGLRSGAVGSTTPAAPRGYGSPGHPRAHGEVSGACIDLRRSPDVWRCAMSTGPDELRARRERDVAALLSQIYLEEEIGLLRRGGRQPAAGARPRGADRRGRGACGVPLRAQRQARRHPAGGP